MGACLGLGLVAVIVAMGAGGGTTQVVVGGGGVGAGGGGAGTTAQNPDVPQHIPDPPEEPEPDPSTIPQPEPEPEPEEDLLDSEEEEEPQVEHTVSITVVDGDGLAVPGAVVDVGGGKRSTVSSTGTARFGLLPGRYVAATTASDTHNAPLEPHAFGPTSVAFTVPDDLSVSVPMIDYTFFESGGRRLRHSEIRRGVRENRPVSVTFSFIPPGAPYTVGNSSYFTSMYDHQDGTHSSGHVTALAMQDEIRSSLRQISDLFQATFASTSPSFRLNWTEIVEPRSPPVALTASHVEGQVGLFRFGMGPVGSNGQTLAYAFVPGDGRGEGEWCDTVLNNRVDFRKDVHTVTQDNGSYSIMWIVLHEVLHALGLGHSASGNSLMAPVAGRSFRVASRFPAGISASTGLRRMLRVLYGSD